MPTRKIEDLLTEHHSRFTPLQRLLSRTANQKQWTAELRALLPTPFCNEVEVSDIKGPTAYIVCQSAAAATRLRFLLPEFQTQLKTLQSFSHVQDFRLRVSQS
ncbi:MAG: DUF721 domain-containing protein [Pseudomonadales bacterium]|nr:DUF721 domain-containing protein [Pseudomonadales bacterium]